MPRLFNIECERRSGSPNPFDLGDVVDCQPLCSAEGAHAAGQHKAAAGQAGQTDRDGPIERLQLPEQCGHGQARAEFHLLCCVQIAEVLMAMQIQRPALVSGATAGGATGSHLQWRPTQRLTHQLWQ